MSLLRKTQPRQVNAWKLLNTVVHCKRIQIIMKWYSSGSRDGTMVSAFTSHQCVPGSIPRPGVTWVEFVVSSLLYSERFFSMKVLWFSPLLKNQHFQIPIQSLQISLLLIPCFTLDMHIQYMWLHVCCLTWDQAKNCLICFCFVFV